jgi:hypothetical protein
MASGPRTQQVNDWVTVQPKADDWVDVKPQSDDWVASPGRGSRPNLPKLTPDTSNRPGFLRTLWDKSVLNLPQSIPAFGEMLKRGGDVKQSIEGLEQITPEMWAAHDARIKATRQTGQPTRRETFIGPPVDSSSQDESSWGEIAGTMASEPLNAAILGAATGMAVKGFRLAKKAAAAKVGKKADKLATAKREDAFSQMLAQYEGAAEREAAAATVREKADKLATAKGEDAFSQMLAQYEGAAERGAAAATVREKADKLATAKGKDAFSQMLAQYVGAAKREATAKGTKTANASPSSAASAATGNPASGASTTLGESESVYKSGAHDSMFVQDDNVVNKISNISQYIKETGGLTPAQLDGMTDAGFRVIADDAVKWGAAKGNPVPKTMKYDTASVNGSTYAKIKRELHPDVYDTASLNKHIPTSRMKGGKK